jgi:hypothetical protein
MLLEVESVLVVEPELSVVIRESRAAETGNPPVVEEDPVVESVATVAPPELSVAEG